MGSRDWRYVDQLVGARVKRAMRAAGWDQEDLAGRLGVAQATVSRKLAGVRPWGTGELVVVADALGVTVGALFGEPVEEPDAAERAAGRRAVAHRLQKYHGRLSA